MIVDDAAALYLGAVVLGVLHGAEPGHGWPIAASYALDRPNRWLHGFAASVLLGVGHLVSSIAMVAVFFFAKSYFDLTRVNEPISLGGGVEIGGPVSVVAGVVLILLGVREYRHGHSHGRGGGHAHDSDAHEHDHDGRVDDGHEHHGHREEHVQHDHHDHHEHHEHHDHENDAGILSKLASKLPFVGGHSHGHDHDHDAEAAADRGLLGIAWFAFLLGFAHEEEFEIIALCGASTRCLELMLLYALTVIVAIVALTLLLIAGYERYEERVEAYAGYLPLFSAIVLFLMGLGFVLGVL